MPDLSQSLQNRDIGHLRIVAELWGVNLKSVETETALEELSLVMLDQNAFGEIIDTLPSEARSAIIELGQVGGKIPWAAFTRRFGEIRDTGAGRRDREQVYLNPISSAEFLFYRGLLARGFFDTSTGLQEFAFIPEDLLRLLIRGEREEAKAKAEKLMPSVTTLEGLNDQALGHAASLKEHEHPLPVNDSLLEDATTLLAALRMGQSLPDTPVPARVIMQFLSSARIIVNEIPQIEPVRNFLESSREHALKNLVDSWRVSESFNELHQIPGLVCEGEWVNKPLPTREFLLNLIKAIPVNKWWSLNAFLVAIKEKYPDFQRPGGDYNSWFIRREADGEYLRGFDHWDSVDGALIRYFITGPLQWLQIVELATPEKNDVITAFRIPGLPDRKPVIESAKLNVGSQGRISVPKYFPRAVRYQIARFCEWEAPREDGYRYQVTTSSLKKAKEQGLKVNQLLSLLAKNSATEIPPAFIKALKRWELKGTEARVETQTVLRVGSPEVLEELRKSKAARFLGEILGPVTVIIKPGAQAKILAALSELGFLAEDVHEE